MAIVERVEAQLVADAGQFVAGLNRATTALGQLLPATQRLQAQLDQVTADFAAGKISGEQYGAAMARINGQLTTAGTAIQAAEQRIEMLTASLLEGKITAQQFGVEMDRIRAGLGTGVGAMAGMAAGAGKATVGFKRFENVMTGLVISTLPGMTGATGRAANALTGLSLAFAGLGPYILPILIALGAYAVAADRAKKSSDALFESLQVGTQRRQRELDVIAGSDNIDALRRRLAQQEALVAAFDARQLARAQQGLALEDDTEGVAAARIQIDALTARIAFLGATQQSVAVPAAAKWRAAIEDTNAALKEQFELLQRLAGMPDKTVEDNLKDQLAEQAKLAATPDKTAENDLKAQMEALVLAPMDDVNHALARAGQGAATALVYGMLDGFKDLEGILKSFLASFIQATIIGPLFSGLKIFSPSHVTRKVGEQVGMGLVVGMHATRAAVNAAALDLAPVGALSSMANNATRAMDLSLNANLNVQTGALPAPGTPFEVARDAHWQRILRESVLVARSQGAKV